MTFRGGGTRRTDAQGWQHVGRSQSKTSCAGEALAVVVAAAVLTRWVAHCHTQDRNIPDVNFRHVSNVVTDSGGWRDGDVKVKKAQPRNAATHLLRKS